MIYLARHGETDFNRIHRMQGQMESTLTDLGRRQAAAMGDLLLSLTARDAGASWRLVSSPLGRAHATARAIASPLNLEVEVDRRLMEISVGDWQGRLYSEILEADPSLRSRRDWLFHAPGGETYDQVMARVGDWLAEQGEVDERRLIVVSHGVAGMLLRGAYAGLPRDRILDQDAPQDAIYRLGDGRLERIACEPVG